MTNRRHSAVALSTLLFLSPAAVASEWGCQVLLCLANPAGPMAVGACVPPITKLWKALNKPKPDPFPTCEEANSSNGDSFAKPGYGHFDKCPAGTAALGAGVAAIQLAPATYRDLTKSNPAYFGTDLQAATRLAISSASPLVGIGEGEGLQPTADQPLSNKVCVAGELGLILLPAAKVEDGQYQALAYQQVVTLPPKASGRYIDVFVNGNLFTRVRY